MRYSALVPGQRVRLNSKFFRHLFWNINVCDSMSLKQLYKIVLLSKNRTPKTIAENN